MKGYFVKPSHGAVRYFRCDLNGISYGINENNKPDYYELLEEEGKKDYDVLIDNMDVIHLVCRNDNGDIIYFCCENNIWTRKTIMKSKYPSKYEKFLRIVRCHNTLSIFYIIEKDKKKMLVHQFLRDDIKPTVLGYIRGEYDVTTDSGSNIYVAFYDSDEEKLLVLRYIWAEKKWSIFKKPGDGEFFESICIMTDFKDNLYMVTCENKNIYLYSDRKRLLEKGKEPVIIISDYVYIMFTNAMKDKIYTYRILNNRFEKTSIISNDGYRKNAVFKISYNSTQNKIKAKKCYGNISAGGFELYNAGDFLKFSDNEEVKKENKREEDREFIRHAYIESEKNLIKIKNEMEEMNRKIKSLQTVIDNIKNH